MEEHTRKLYMKVTNPQDWKLDADIFGDVCKLEEEYGAARIDNRLIYALEHGTTWATPTVFYYWLKTGLERQYGLNDADASRWRTNRDRKRYHPRVDPMIQEIAAHMTAFDSQGETPAEQQARQNSYTKRHESN